MTDASAVSDARSDDADHRERSLLSISREEARTALDHQIRTLDDIDTKASKILRLNVALLSILLMGTSVLAKSPTYEAAELLTPLSLIGVGSLLVSTAFAGLTYTSSEFQTGLGPEDLRSVFDSEYDDEQFQEALVASYAEWMAFNGETNVRNEFLITLTIVSAVYAVALLTLGVIDVFLGSIPGFVVLFALCALAVFTLLTGLLTQLARWNRAVEPVSTVWQKTLDVAKRFSYRRNNK